ncbi:carboxypeptidase B-like [Cherax quadricarinatus]|uniref:carboxypeptidase B-like n=1 Tax=Cherax quadricarinatus TaxID=27406 RepID=UPI0023786348|nr:carboxypeptidase B-like [Cherax quadricarinatus]
MNEDMHVLTWVTMILLIMELACGSPILTEEEIRSLQKEDPVSYSGYKLFRTDVALVELPVVDSLGRSDGVDVWSWRKKAKEPQYEVDLLTPPAAVQKVREVFSEYNLTYQEVINDLQSAINEEHNGEDEFFSWNRPAHPMTWQKYHSSQDMNLYLDYLQSQYPDLVTIMDIGLSFENRPLRVAKVSNGTNKPAVWIDGGIHAREWVSSATAMYILHRLVEFSWEEPDLISNFDWYIMPMSNPDGYEYSRHHDRLWRKNRSVDPRHPQCVGADPNRNFGFQWLTGGSSDNPCSSVYAGREAFSEPETRAIGNFLLDHKDQLKVYATLHAYSQMWMLPWGYTLKSPAAYNDMIDVGRLATLAIRENNGTEYALGQITELMYIASGNSGDYAHSIGIPYSYCLELRDLGHYGFILPKEQIEPTGNETYQGIKAMVRGVYAKLFPVNQTLPAMLQAS